MKQQYVLLRCGECQQFQVHIEKKKTPAKFACTICRSTQPISRIYARSSKASDCRKLCQEYNVREQTPETISTTVEENDSIHADDDFERWDGFVSEEEHGRARENATVRQGPNHRHVICEDGDDTRDCSVVYTGKRARSPACRDQVANQYRRKNRVLGPWNIERVSGTKSAAEREMCFGGVPHSCNDGDAWFAEYVVDEEST